MSPSTSSPVAPLSTDTLVAPRGARLPRMPAYVWLLTLFIPLTLFSGYTDQMGLPLPPDRLFFAAGMGLLLLTPQAWRRLRFRWVHGLFVAAVLGVLLSCAMAGNLTQSQPLFALLDRVLLPFVLFTVAPVVWSTPARRDLLLRCLVAVGVYLGCTAVLEFVAPELVWPRYIVDPDAGIQFGRARGPFGASEAAGLVMAMTAAACGLAVARLAGWWRFAASVGLLAGVVGMALTMTRSIWLAAVLGLVVICYLERRVRGAALGAAVAAALIGAMVLLAVPSLTESFTERATTSRSLYDRANTNAAGLRIVAEQPLTGIGWQRFMHDGIDYVRQADQYPLTNIRIEIHNVPLSRAAELGVPIALVYCLAVVASLVLPLMGRRRDREQEGWRLVAITAVIAWGVAAMLSPVPYPTANYLVWLYAGLVAAPFVTRDRGLVLADPGPERRLLQPVPGGGSDQAR